MEKRLKNPLVEKASQTREKSLKFFKNFYRKNVISGSKIWKIFEFQKWAQKASAGFYEELWAI